ncbi:MAG: hypothetical protein ACPIFP_02865 [Candidatus Poseidoniaceae archaeon]
MRRAVGLVLLLLVATGLPVVPHALEDAPHPPFAAWSTTETAFEDGSTEHTDVLCSGCGGTASFTTTSGAALTVGAANLTLEPTSVSEQASYSFAAGTLTGTPTNMTVGQTGLSLTTTLGGPPQSGNTSQQVSTAVQWSGTKTFDTLHLTCNGAVCGSVTGTNLTIIAREIILETGTSISVDGAASTGTGTGSSTTTPANGRSDGAGGGGHGGAGGAGGGTSGGSGGSTYGNGTEMGSPGGDVSGNSNYGDAYGGHGGGHLILRAGALTVNGSLLANGAGGDPGVSPNGGTGAGGSGGGGGSGGSIDVQVNTLSVGTTGVISANGGAGGDGEDGQQSGIGFGMYDGGDGGGGGGGGYVRISTVAGGSTSLGSITASAGGGGLKGLKYGTGIDGYDGDVGVAGTVSTSTWSGYATGSVSAMNGAFIGDTIPFSSAQGPLWMNHSVTVPANTTLEIMVRTSMSPPGTSSPAWSPWAIVPAQNAPLERASFLQLAYAMTRNSSASPVVTGVTLDWERSTVVDGLSMNLDNQPLTLTRDTHLLTDVATLDLANAALTFSVPEGAAAKGESRLWIGWTPTDAALMVEHATVGVLLDVDTDTLPGADLVMTEAEVNTMLSGAPSRTANDGRVWRDVTLNLAATEPLTDLGLTLSHVAVPWSVTTPVSFAQATNTSIVQQCGSIYLSTTCDLGGAHDITYSTGLGTDSGTLLSLGDLTLTWLDDEPPRLDRVIHRYGGVDEPELRLGDRTVLVVEDLIDESTATADIWLSANVGAEEDKISTAWSGSVGGWVAAIDTAEHLSEAGSLSVSLRLIDEHGNVANMASVYWFDVLDSLPEVSTLTIDGDENTPLLEGTRLAGVWESEQPNFTIAVTDAGLRDDLSASVDLVRDGTATTLEAEWDSNAMAYVAEWRPGRSGLGAWTVEAHLSESTGPGDSDDDGLVAGPDATLELVDRTAPGNLSISAPSSVVLGEPLMLSGSWAFSPDEHGVASLTVFGPEGDEVAVKGISMSAETTIEHLVPANLLTEGDHTVRLDVRDDVGNVAAPVETVVKAVEPVGVFGSVNLFQPNPTSFEATWDVQTDEPLANITVFLNGNAVHRSSIEEGNGSLTFDLLTVAADVLGTGATSTSASIEVCHINVSMCVTNTTLLDLADLQDLGLGGSCIDTVPNGNATDIIVCQLSNEGLRPVELSWVTSVDGSQDGWNLTLQPGAERTLWEANPAFILHNEAHRSTQAWTVSWALTAAHGGGPITVLHEGEFSFVPSTVDDVNKSTTDEGSAGGSGGGVTVLIVAVIALLGAGSLMLTLRTSAQQRKAKAEETPPLQEASSGTSTWPNEATPEVSKDDAEALAYHADLLEQGYSDEDATAYTRKYFPDFQA